MVPLVIVPLLVPLKVPEPEVTLNCTVVLLVTFCGRSPASRACTVTLKACPCVGLAGTDEKLSLVGTAGTPEAA